ncbi:MAG: transposase [Candidatus Kapaibacterium sp.]
MSYNPHIHHRKSIRLHGYDYSQAGAYFITICTQDREHRFGKIENDEMVLNEYGIIAYNEWNKLTERFSNFESDVFQIMPNHMHGIIVLNPVGAGFTPALNDKGQPQGLPVQISDDDDIGAGASPAPTIGDIVGAYKSLVANACLEIWKLKWAGVNPVPHMGKLWQRNYYEHIIRNEQSYQSISEYIVNNPAKWKDDKFYKE